MSDWSETHLLALVLARSLDFELPHTRRVCLDDISSPVLANELEETTTLLEGALADLHVLRSYLRPINRLPPEILVHIFSFLGGGASVVFASHVCRRWRNVALGTPSLWTVIREDDDMFAAQCFMERSRHAKLDFSIIIDMREPEDFAIFRILAMPHAARIRRLHVRVCGDRVYDFYRFLAARDFFFPILEHFSIRMIEYGWRDDTHEGPLPSRESFFGESEFLERLTFRAALPLPTHLSPAIRSLTLSERIFDLDDFLDCLNAAPNLEYLALLDCVPHTFESNSRGSLVSLHQLKEFNWFQVTICDDNVVGTVKLFEHLVMPNLVTTLFVLLLDPAKYFPPELYTPCGRSVSLFSSSATTITELHLEASHFAPEKPARNNIVFHGRRHNDHETLFSIRVNRCVLASFCTSEGISLISSIHVKLTHLTHLTLTSKFSYDWNRFFQKSWSCFLRSIPSVKVLRLYVSKPIEILTAILTADELSDTSSSSSSLSPYLPNLQVLHLFCRGASRRSARHGSAADSGDTAAPAPADTDPVRSIFEGEDDEENLLRFLRHRADLGIPIKIIVCSADDAAALALHQPEAPPPIDSIESGLFPEGIWGEPMFPRRLIPLLEEHLD